MVDAGGLDQTDDMVGDLLEARLGRRAVLGLDVGQLGLGIGDERRLAIGVARTTQPVAQSLRHEAGHECRHDQPAVRLEPLENVVGSIARMIAQRKGVGMRQRHRRFGHVKHAPHRIVRGVGEIDHDAEAVEFADHRASERR